MVIQDSRKRSEAEPRARGRRGSAAVKTLAIGLGAVVLVILVVILVQEGGGGSPDFAAIRGRWLRPDGGYVLEIRGVAADGTLEASYLNPRPIHVARARATRDGTRTRVFIELDDTGYPGCTYDLLHDTGKDILAGTYFQAAMRQRFDVYFERQR